MRYICIDTRRFDLWATLDNNAFERQKYFNDRNVESIQ